MGRCFQSKLCLSMVFLLHKRVLEKSECFLSEKIRLFSPCNVIAGLFSAEKVHSLFCWRLHFQSKKLYLEFRQTVVEKCCLLEKQSLLICRKLTEVHFLSENPSLSFRKRFLRKCFQSEKVSLGSGSRLAEG